MSATDAAFAANLKRHREAVGFTQLDLASRLGVPMTTLRNWEQGRREPRLAMLRLICQILDVRADALLAEDTGVPVAQAPAPKKARGRKKGG
jgi:transcriptional regulator with XRE-family HTH domain